MSGLSALLANHGVGLAQADRVIQSIPYFHAAQMFDRSGVASANVAALCGLLDRRRQHASASNDLSAAARHEDLLFIFADAERLTLPPPEALKRAHGRCEDVRLAFAAEDLDAALAFHIASHALAPTLPAVRQDRLLIKERLTERSHPTSTEPNAALLRLALRAAMESDASTLNALSKSLYDLGDYALSADLCEQAQGLESSASDWFDLDVRRRSARLRLDGSSPSTAAEQATIAACLALIDLGPSPGLSDEWLVTRIHHCLPRMGYRQALADLREMALRHPDSEWVAKNICFALRNALHPDAAAAIDLLSRSIADQPDELQRWFGAAYSMGANEQALAFAARLSAFKPEYQIFATLHAFVTDPKAQPAVKFGKPAGVGRRICASLVYWGERYLDLMEQTSLASLLAPGNLPALSQQASVALELYTMPADLDRLRASEILRRVAAFCEVRIHVFPDSVAPFAKSLPYIVFGFGSHGAILRAEREGADVMFLFPDVIYADGGFAALTRRLSDLPFAVFQDGLNCLAGPMIERMAPFHRDGLLIAPRQALIDAAASCFSKRTLDNIYRPGDVETSLVPTRVLFRTREGLRAHALAYSPLYVSHAALAPLIMKNFGPIDDVFSEHLLLKLRPEQFEIMPPAEALIIEVCHDHGATNPIQAQGLRDTILSYFQNFGLTCRRHRLFERGIDYISDAFIDGDVVEEAEVALRLSEVRDLFESHPCFVDLGAEQEKIAARCYGAGLEGRDQA